MRAEAPRVSVNVRLQRVERALEIIAQREESLKETSEALESFDERDPQQTEAFLSAVVSVGKERQKVETLKSRTKPYLEGEAQRIKEELQFKLELAERSWREIEALFESGFLTEEIFQKALESYESLRNSLSLKESLSEKIFTHESELTTVGWALLAVWTAEAYTMQQQEEIFALNKDFYHFFGKLGHSLTGLNSRADDSLDQIKKNIIGRFFVSDGNTPSVGESELEPAAQFAQWLHEHVPDKASFCSFLASQVEQGDIDPREKFKMALFGSLVKLYGLHPKMFEHEKYQPTSSPAPKSAEVATVVGEEGAPVTVKGTNQGEDILEREKVEKGQVETESTSQPGRSEAQQDMSEAEGLILFLWKNFDNPVVAGELRDARARAEEAGILSRDRLLILYNWEYFKQKAQDLSSSQVAQIKAVIGRIRRAYPKKVTASNNMGSSTDLYSGGIQQEKS